MLNTTRDEIVIIVAEMERISWQLRRLAADEIAEAARHLEYATEGKQLMHARTGLEFVASVLEDLMSFDQDNNDPQS